MQRIRETERGLQFTQDMGVVTFSPDEKGDLRVNKAGSYAGDESEGRFFMVEGRDNMRDFAEWLTRLVAEDPAEPTHSSFDTYTVDQKKWVAVISTTPKERGVSLGAFLGGDHEGLGTDAIEDLSALIDSLGEAVGRPPRDLTRVEQEAFAYPFGIPEGLTPVMLAVQNHDTLQLQLDELFIHGSVPFESARQLGAWSLQGLAEIQKKSVWG